MAFNPQTAPLYISGTSTMAPTDATQACVTAAIDCLRANNAGFQFTLAGMTGTISVAVKVQVSNAVPPQGISVGKFPIAGTLGTTAWQPPESSWVDAVDGSGNAVSATFAANGTGILNVYAPFLGRWTRGVSTPAAGGQGGTLQVDVFVRSPGDN